MRGRNEAVETYEGWVRAHSAELYRYAYRLTGASHQAEDLVQETFTEAWKSMRQLRDPERARGWLFQILRHRYSRLRRGEARRPESKSHNQAAPEEISATQAINHVDQNEWIQHCLAQLDEPARQATLAVMIQGLTCREAAAELNAPIGTILSRLHRARGLLREYLNQENRSAEAGMKK